MLVINLPLPPSVNTYWRANGKRRFISKEGMLFRENVLVYCIENKVSSFGDKRLQFQVTLYPRDKRIQDIDNRIKALFDALEGLAYDSDSQIDVLIVQRGEIKKGGGCLVMIEVLEDNK